MTWVTENKRVLPKKETIKFNDYNFTIRLHYDNLSDERLQKITDKIQETLPKFRTLFDLEKSGSAQELQLYVYNNEHEYRKYTGLLTNCGYFDPKSNKMYIYQTSHESGNVTLGSTMEMTIAKVPLSKVEIVEFPQYNFQVELYYNDLNPNQLARAKQEIINVAYDFNEAFDLTESYLVSEEMKMVSPNDHNVTRKFQILLYDNYNDFKNYANGTARGYAEDACGRGIYVSNAYTYKHNPKDISFIEAMRHEFGHSLTACVDGGLGLSQPTLDGVAGYVQRQLHPVREKFEEEEFTNDLIKKIINSKVDTDNHLGYYPSIAFFMGAYPEVIGKILHNRRSYDSALEHFRKEFPYLVEHISDEESFEKYDYEFFDRIFENPEVKQKLLDFIEDKLTEKKYIDKVNDINAFRVVKGDHIGTDKNTGEEYYQGIIVNDKGEIGAFSPVEYSFSRKGINVFNHATKDSIIIPKKYHNLKLVKVDSNLKLAFCDKNGNEYRDTEACKSKTDDFIYTDDAQEAFTHN